MHQATALATVVKVAILETGAPPANLAERFGRYDAMFRELLGPGFETVTYRAHHGELPQNPSDHQAYLITGSPADSFAEESWILALKAFVRSAREAKLVGVCFGHQVMAEALGGKVVRADAGWGVGLHRYEIRAREPWMDEAKSIAIPVSHRDQIVVAPPESRVIAASAFSPYGALAYDDRPAISFQFHPEFAPGYAKALIETRRERLPDPEEALRSLDQPNDRARVAAWIRRFLRG